ncbi:MAG: hypothetical protein HXX10_23305 [Rhodoplanes sp.]|uniref:hypothetical protein n=1 Tax=Rhodoplanes sp. TaxID=1968906 RepID=UPI00179A8143|nr:hypothetical protein [Rhodoplanes sp.]NVO16964.1 hypothetical protein [Rhodoplanes sp.]
MKDASTSTGRATASAARSRSTKSTAAKKPAPKKAAAKPTAKKGAARKYGVVGTTRDGVVILGPAVKPTHFTSDEIRTTIRELFKKA